ncbi:MAG: DNA methyltransferase [Planctomycetota bacterium]
MDELNDESVHLIVTSPPYWQLKDYGSKEQIGYNDTYQNYINNLNLVWSQCHRVLHEGCRLCVNIGDQFARSVYYGRYKIIPIRTEIIRFCETIGFDYMGAIIWQKVTTCNTTGGATIMGSFPYPRNGIVKIDYEFILLFKKYGKAPSVPRGIKEQSKLSKEEWNQYFYGHWNFSGAKQDAHLAPFPEELPKRLIKMFSFVGDTVLDPFLGSGTTSVAARSLSRDSVGYEVNSDYLAIIEKRLGESAGLFGSDNKVEIIRQEPKRVNFESDIGKLPYVFQDPVSFERKIDPKTLRFGSRIDGQEIEKERFCAVKKVLSPSELLLESGARVRLIGVLSNGENRMEAVRFLEDLVAGQKVSLRFDHTKHDSDGILLSYVYLRNKTHVNAHMVKSGLVAVDTGSHYRMKGRFLSLIPQEVR